MTHNQANHCFTVQGTRVVAIVPMEDENIHTAENGYTCGDPTCPCAAESVDESTMPDDLAMYYVPIEERSYDHPGVPAPCWEHVDEDADAHRNHEDWEDYL